MSIPFSDFQDPRKLVLIAGPCVIESEEHVNRMADAIAAIADAAGFPGCLKASFDKANRTSLSWVPGSWGRGRAGHSRAAVRQRGFSVLTDIHEPAQAAQAAEAVDILQNPGVPLPPDRFAARSGPHREDRQYQKGPVHGAARYSSLGGEGGLNRERAGWSNDRDGVRLSGHKQPGRRYARFANHGGCGVASGVRRYTQRSVAERRAGTASGGRLQFIEPLAAARCRGGSVRSLRPENCTTRRRKLYRTGLTRSGWACCRDFCAGWRASTPPGLPEIPR